MDFSDYLMTVTDKYEKEANWRLGQTYFNVFTYANPRLAEEVRGSLIVHQHKISPAKQDRLRAFVLEQPLTGHIED